MANPALTPETLGFKRMTELDAAWRAANAGDRLREVRRAAPKVRERILESGDVTCVRTMDLAVLPYPTDFAFGGAALSPLPFVTMTNRMNLVQFETDSGSPRTILFNPTDAERSAETPYFADFQRRLGPFIASRVKPRLLRPTAVEHLAAVGLRPDEVDFIAFDHLHTQDLRRILGTDGLPAMFPRAKLLVWRPELDILRNLHPLQEPWFIREALTGVPADRFVVFDDGDWLLGKGAALVRTPGHTVGNWSLALATDGRLWVVSENGVSCDNYAPHASRIPGLRRHAKKWGVEVVLNANTLEGRNDQYTSMILERILADRCPENPDFYRHFPSSELTASPLSPGLAPTFAHRKIEVGSLRKAAQPRGETAVHA
jgi:hypothetical protein